jgi:hypothetical protein
MQLIMQRLLRSSVDRGLSTFNTDCINLSPLTELYHSQISVFNYRLIGM